ncbi:MAG: shikimate dehydrogenase [Gammaproteobacteria bacterium]|nr:shikimate dehydrogenase [Gammaproteobacteria bacterium]
MTQQPEQPARQCCLLLAVVGNPIAHSKSPQIHKAFGEQLGIDVDYRKTLAEIGAFASCVAELRANGARGCNVTIPFKQDAFEYCDRLSERAAQAGAVNTLIFDTEVCRGDNTDGFGLVHDLVNNLHVAIGGRRILVLGAGGATRGVLAPLLAQGPQSLHVANRTAGKARTLIELFADAGNLSSSGLADIPERDFDLIINATAASLGQSLPPLPDTLLRNGGAVYDLVYAEAGTPFLHWGEQAGASLAADGLGMLVEQAAESFFLWTGRRPRTAEVLEAMRARPVK